MSAFEMAPACVARVASVPRTALESQCAPGLAQRALAAEPEAFAAEYAEVVETHRRRLWEHTVGDARVRCGLALASPTLAEQLPSEPPARRNKSTRHLETSLVRYLSRAVGRIDPCGLWTGVTLAWMSEQPTTQVRPRAASTHVAPDLGPLRDLVRSLAEREPYREQGPWRLNPTLQPGRVKGWRYAQRHQDGQLTWRTLPPSRAWGELAACASEGRAYTLSELRERLSPIVSEPVAAAILGFALDAGLLLGGLQFPTRFESPWEALERMHERLDPVHRVAWAWACARMREACADVERALDRALASDSVDDRGGRRDPVAIIERGHRAVRWQIESLAQTLHVPVPALPSALLRVDETAPFEIELGTDDQEHIQHMLDRWSTLERHHRTDRRWTRRAMRTMDECPTGQLYAPPAHAKDESNDPDSELRLGPPLGALVVRPGAGGLGDPWVRGLSQAPTVTHARHAYHLAEHGDPLLPWLQACYRDLFEQTGVEAVDLAVATNTSPNVLARPAYVEQTLDPWTGGGSIEIEDLRMVAGAEPSAVLLGDGLRRLSAHVFTALRVPTSDVLVHRLMATSFDDRTEQAVSPRPLDGPVDAVFRHPRAVELDAEEIEALVTVRGATRYVRWQQVIERHGLGGWVRVRCGHKPALLIPTDGPLPVEAAFEGARGVTSVVIEEVRDDAWLPGPDGGHFVEFVVPVRRTQSAWSRECSLSPSESAHACR